MINIALLGSTGSIGRQVLNVVDRHKDKFKIVSLSAGANAKLLQEQINTYRPKVATLADPSQAIRITQIPKETSFYYGEDSMLHAVLEEADVVFVAVMGFAGLKAVIEAIKLKKTIALANKETLVAGGELVMRMAQENGVNIIPVDSEHSALFQCLGYDKNRRFKKLILTASGGAFRNLSYEELKDVTAKDALKHPTWLMGKKITVDCATMLNKGLEVIEAMWLYDAPLSKIDVVVHPQSIVHSMVEFDDSAVMAQMSYPSMEIPIQLALTYPNRLITDVPSLSLAGKTLEFLPMDYPKHPCFNLAIESIKRGGVIPCAMNAANEEAVKLFLEDKIKFLEIADFIEYGMSNIENLSVNYQNLLYVDNMARVKVKEKFAKR